jgi:acyl carrier protein
LTDLEIEIRDLIVDVLSLEDVNAEDVGLEEDLFSDDGLALDSIDALEIGVAIQKKYAIKLDSKDEKVTEYFQNIKSIAELVNIKKGE